MHETMRFSACALFALAWAIASCSPSQGEVISLRCQHHPVDPAQQNRLGVDGLSHWLQPWRAWQETAPATRLRNGLGFALQDGEEAGQRARTFAQAGFAFASIEYQWQDMDPSDPSALSPRGFAKRETLRAARAAGLRPLLLLDAYRRGPAEPVTAVVTTPAAAGAHVIQVSPASGAGIVPGLTLLAGESILITALSETGEAMLSRPLPRDVPTGDLALLRLVFAPFSRTQVPEYATSLQGWLAFVAAVARDARTTLGDDQFDVELWNGVGSPALSLARHFETALGPQAQADLEATASAIVHASATWLRDPGNGFTNVRAIDGTKGLLWQSGGTSVPSGLWAYARSVSVSRLDFSAQNGEMSAQRWVDARGGDATQANAYSPTYSVLFPELHLTALTARQIIPDLLPWQVSTPQGQPRGRTASGGSAPPAMVAIDAFSFHPSPSPGDPALQATESRRALAKAALRAAVAYTNRGVNRLQFYEANELTRLTEPGGSGGPVLGALQRLQAALDGPPVVRTPRSVTVDVIVDCARREHVPGNGTQAHPGLTEADLTAAFPFQADDNRFVIASYVMTRDLLRRHAEGPGGVHDLPARPVILVLSGLRAERARVTVTDPLDGLTLPHRIIHRDLDRIWIELSINDSPRLLEITDG